MDVMFHLFSVVCGQAPEHTWGFDGDFLPCCQRCTGLYLGAFVAALLHLVLRPHLTGRFLEVHGAFLLLMVPFGYHWLPQGPGLRAATGALFGFGLVTFLQLPLPKAKWLEGHPGQARSVLYFVCAALTALILPWLGTHGGQPGFMTLAAGSAGGALVLLLLVVGNIAVAIAAFGKVLACLTRRKADA